MGTTISRLNYKIVADTGDFRKGIVLTRKELSEARRIMRETQTPAERLGQKIDEAGRLYRRGAISLETYNRRVAQLRREKMASTPVIGKFVNAIADISPAAIAAGAAVAAIATGAIVARRGIQILTDGIKEQLDEIDKITKAARSVGVAAEELVGLRMAAAEFSGMTGEQFDTSLKRMTVNLGDAARGTGEAKQALDALGLSVEQLLGQSPDKSFLAIADAIQATEDPTMRAYAAQKLFGRQGVSLINTLAAGRDGIAAVQREAERLGLTFEELDARNVELANDSIGRMKATFDGLMRTAAIELAPTLTTTATFLTDFAVSTRENFEGAERSATGLTANITLLEAKIAKTLNTLQDLKLLWQALGVHKGAGSQALKLFRLGSESGREQAKKEAAEFRSELVGQRAGDAYLQELAATKQRIAGEMSKLGIGAAANIGPDLETHLDLTQTTSDAVETSEDAVGSYIQQLEGERRALVMTSDQLKLYELAQQGADRSTVRRVATIQRHLREMQRLKAMRDDARKMVESLKTPQQKYAESIMQLTEMYRRKMLTLRQFVELKRRAAEQLQKPITLKIGAAGVQGTRAGSQAARLQLEADRNRVAAARRAGDQRRAEQELFERMDRHLEMLANRPGLVVEEARL